MSSEFHHSPTQVCPDVEQLKAWVDRELAVGAERMVGAHVDTCTACQEESHIMRQIGNSLKELESLVEPPAHLRKRILEGVNDTARRPAKTSLRNPFVLVRWGAAAAAAVMAVFIGLNVLTGTSGLPRNSSGASKSGSSAGGQAVMQSPTRTASSQAAQPQNSVGAAGGGGAMGSPPGAPAAAGYLDGHLKLETGRKNGDPYASAPGMLVSPNDVNVYTRGAEVDDVKRKVVRTAVLSIRTRSALEGLQKEIQARLSKDDGFVESANLTTPEGGERTVTMRLRVPVDKLDEYVTWLASLGEVRAKNIRGQDVTGTWIDQRAEVRELRREEARLLKVYNTDRNRDRRNEARWQLLRVRPRIAASEERFALTTKLAALSTVELTLVEPAQARIQGNLWLDTENTARSAVAAFLLALRVPAALVIWLVVFSPLWLPCILLYRWASQRAYKWQSTQDARS